MAAVLAVCTRRGARLAVERLVAAVVVVCETYGRARLLHGKLVCSNKAAAEEHGAWAIVAPFRQGPLATGASRLFAFWVITQCKCV